MIKLFRFKFNLIKILLFISGLTLSSVYKVRDQIVVFYMLHATESWLFQRSASNMEELLFILNVVLSCKGFWSASIYNNLYLRNVSRLHFVVKLGFNQIFLLYLLNFCLW